MNNNTIPTMNIEVGDIYEDCSFHPMKCTKRDGDDITGISLLTGTEKSCSVYHCGCRKLIKEEIDACIEVYAVSGERGLMRLNGWTEDMIDKFMEAYR